MQANAYQHWPADLGIKPGDTIQLMADLTRIAWRTRKHGSSFSAQDFLDAFVEAVGPSGNVLVPTFNYDLLPGDAFDRGRTRSISGALAQAALVHPRFRRTPHALHSFAVIGVNADELLNSDEPGSFGPRSPFAFLHAKRAALITLDLPLNDALTFTHYVEEQVGVPYREHTEFPIRYTDLDGSTTTRLFTAYAKRPGHIMDFTPLKALLLDRGALSESMIDGARSNRVDLGLAYEIIKDDIVLNKARTIHQFYPLVWAKHQLKTMLRRFGINTAQERAAHAARLA